MTKLSHGITVYPREDEWHIRRQDTLEICNGTK
jgi:pyridoxine 5'-phosphate synthase PdxJ